MRNRPVTPVWQLAAHDSQQHLQRLCSTVFYWINTFKFVKYRSSFFSVHLFLFMWGTSWGLPRRPRWNWGSCWGTYWGWQPVVGTLGDNERCSCVGLQACVCALSGIGGECPIAWAAGVLDQQSRRAVDMPGDLQCVSVVEWELGTKPLSFGVERVSGLYPII